MFATPTKSSNGSPGCFSPVLLHQSPAASVKQRNLTGLPRVARDAVADLYNAVQKWNESHVDGGILVKRIALLKSDATEEFPKGLDGLMEDLGAVYRRLEIQAKAMSFLASQMGSVLKLQQANPLFMSMSAEQISNSVNEIAKAYNSELTRKEYVLSNIAFSKTRSEALFHAACWVHPQYSNNDVKTKLETLLIETGYRKIN